MALKRLRQSITLEEKLDIIDRVEAGESRVNVGRDYGYSSSTVGTILSNAAKIRRVARSTCRLNATRLTRTRCVIMERMERMLAVWIEERRRRAAPPGAEDIMAEARRIFDELKARDGGRSEAGTFLASRGWLNRFRRRYNSRCDRERNEDGDDKNSQTILPPTNQSTTRLTTAQVEKRSRVSLTAAMKKELCQYKIDHPSVRLTKLFQIFSKKWEAKVGMTTIRDILREKDKWLSLSEQFEDIRRISGGKYRELEDALFDSFLDARRSNEQINDEWLLVNARKIGRKMNITELQYSNGWLRGFKKRYAIIRSRIGGRSSLICSTESKQEILPHTLRSSPKMKHPATFRKHSEVCKLSLRDDLDQMDEYHFVQNRTEEGVVTLQEARTALFKVIAFVSGIPDRDQYLYVLISLLKYFDAYDGHSTYQDGEMKSENVASVNNVDVQCCDDKGTQSVHDEVTAVKEERLSIDGEERDNENVSSKCGSDVLQNGLGCDGGLAVSLNHQQSAGIEPKYARIGVETGIEVMKEEQLSNDGDDGDVYRGEDFVGHSVDEGLVTSAGIQQSRAVRKKYGGQTSRMNKMDDCGKCVVFVDESMKYKCDICEKMFMTHDRCKRHVRSVHSGERPFKCSLCGKAFPEKCALTVHTRVHTGEKPFLCTVCGKSFCSSGGQSHMRCHSGEKPFSCPQCDKSFSRASGLRYHARVHSGEKPYKCSTCGKAFRSSSELTVHRRRHTGERPYRCFICTASFTKLSICKIHMRKHTGEKPFTCHVCGRAFTQKPLLTNHLRVHTGERPFSCTVCGKKFSQSGSLYHHRKMHKN